MSKQESKDEWIEIGILSRHHGLKGGLFLRAHDRRSEFGGYTRVLLKGKTESCEYEVKQSYASAGQPVLVLKGVESREAAEKLLQSKVFISRAEVGADEDELLVGDLVGLRVVAEGHENIGEVVAVVNFGAHENLEILRPGQKATAIFPLLDQYVEEINVEEGYIRVVYVPEFLEEPT